MRYAETGIDLEVDLTEGRIDKTETDPRLMKRHLGGNGTAARIIWDRVRPEATAFSPENLLIFSTGLMVGTPVPACNRTMVDTISPRRTFFSFDFGGYFGPELKHAGYDKLSFMAKHKSGLLWIHNDKWNTDASHLKARAKRPHGSSKKS